MSLVVFDDEGHVIVGAGGGYIKGIFFTFSRKTGGQKTVKK
jgi:hypothetical protein